MPLAALAALGAAGASLWLGGAFGAWLHGDGWKPPTYGLLLGGLLRGDLGSIWPVTPARWVLAPAGALAAVLLSLVGFVALRLLRAQSRARDPQRVLASAGDLQMLTASELPRRAQQLRPSLAGEKPKALAPDDVGVPLGVLAEKGLPLRASWEDVLLAVMAPRAGKTTALAVPAVLSAPGAVVATSNKADLWLTTHTSRAQRGRIWTFDPQGIAHSPQTFTWDPLAGVTGVEDAHRLAGHFVAEVRDAARGDRDFWTAAALDLLTGLLLAAALGRQPLGAVHRWLNRSTSREPVDLLRERGYRQVADALEGTMDGAVETREGIYQTARTAAKALADDRIMAWVEPRHGVDALDPDTFVASTDALYLLSKDGAGSAAPLVAALTDAVFRAGTRAAEVAGGRLDPPLVAVLDEAANICRITDLPDLYSHLGSRGVVPLTILQSYRQGVRVWGEHGMDALWSAATVKLIGAGVDDARFAEDLSRLVGEVDDPVDTYSRGRDGVTRSTTVRRRRVLGPEDIRALPKGQALLLVTGARAALLRLRPWYDGPRAKELTAQTAEASEFLRRRAAAGAERRHLRTVLRREPPTGPLPVVQDEPRREAS